MQSENRFPKISFPQEGLQVGSLGLLTGPPAPDNFRLLSHFFTGLFYRPKRVCFHAQEWSREAILGPLEQ